jgi:predicted  nucleic acid-binding Zn-ribbon protein
MATRKPRARNNHLQEAMTLLIRNQAAFVEQIARNDQERLALQRNTEQWQLATQQWQLKTDEWRHKAEERFDRIEARLSNIEATLAQLPNTILQAVLAQLPKALRKEIGFKSPV